MIWELTLVALLGGILALDNTAAWQTMISRPLVACPLVGLVVGDPWSGLFVGALIQLVWLAEMPLGSSFYPDSTSGGIAGALTACIGRARFDFPELFIFSLALLVALAFSWIGAAVEVKWIRRMNGYLSDRVLRAAAEGRARGLTRFTVLALGAVFAKGVAVTALAYLAVVAILMLCPVPAGGPVPSGSLILVLTVAVLAVAYYLHLLVNRRNWVGFLVGLSAGLLALRLF